MIARAMPPSLLLGFLVFIVVVGIGAGSFAVDPRQIAHVLTGQGAGDMAATVVMEFRLPRIIVAFQTGALMAVSGLVLQVVTRNELSDPSLIGVSHGAALAVVGLIVLWPEAPYALRTPAAFGGALIATLIVQIVTAAGGPVRFILSGIGLSSLLAALISVMLTHGNLQDASSALGWLSGSVNTASWPEVRTLTIAGLVIAPAIALIVRPMTALHLGDDVATGLGINTRAVRLAAITLAVIAAAAATAAVGPLAFVGLTAPHIAARLMRGGLGLRLLLAALTGAALVGFADLLGRTLFAPIQIPAGHITALIGVPVFVAVLHRQGRARANQ